ncbi:helix-turn-helix transcriptional regulator [Tomitella fengzijianii]|uniref:Helix-turn-helix transcriptional regulator n=1 Tax=Tomitella fengzijianii TaxID=2597660 RepID=A0A516X4D8_9ACTN|nr:helix-turn-helix transcriptional regulator [Tomitella fengzijianii]QDQ97949.1 helix-turn-helix transcriptional regulator [Tomitella fengzijianii]
MATIRLRADVLKKLQEMHALNDSTTARAIGVDRSTLHRIKDGATPSAGFIAGAVLTFGVPIESLFSVIEDDATSTAA